MGRVEPELVGLPWNALTRDTMRRLWIVAHTAGYGAPWTHVVLFTVADVVHIFRHMDNRSLLLVDL